MKNLIKCDNIIMKYVSCKSQRVWHRKVFLFFVRSLNHIYSKSKQEFLFFFFLKRSNQKNGTVSCGGSVSGQCVTCPASTLTLLNKGNLWRSFQLKYAAVWLSAVFVVLCCIIHYSSLNVTITLAHISS